jgi:hypothetical protein
VLASLDAVTEALSRVTDHPLARFPDAGWKRAGADRLAA